MLFFAYLPYYFLVCLVDFRHINGVQIHLRCLYGVMPHAFADYWNGYVHVSRYACPCMPCGICGEWHFQPCHFTYLLQIIVDVLQHTMISSNPQLSPSTSFLRVHVHLLLNLQIIRTEIPTSANNIPLPHNAT